jgi:hypothetical protein
LEQKGTKEAKKLEESAESRGKNYREFFSVLLEEGLGQNGGAWPGGI